MSSSEAARKRAQKFSTLERREAWGKLYSDDIVDGDIIMLEEQFYQFEAGTVGLIEIMWDSRVNSPVRSVFFSEDFGICGLPRVCWSKIT